MVLAPEAIARRNAAAIEPDRIQTRCRDDGARAQVFATIEQVSRTAGLVPYQGTEMDAIEGLTGPSGPRVQSC
jgi:hypothetical protein